MRCCPGESVETQNTPLGCRGRRSRCVLWGGVHAFYSSVTGSQDWSQREPGLNATHLDSVLPSPSPEAMAAATPTPLPFVAEKVQRAVVQIAGFSTSNELVGGGTGFFISANGRLVTCWHVVAHAKVHHIRATLSDGSTCEVEGVLGSLRK